MKPSETKVENFFDCRIGQAVKVPSLLKYTFICSKLDLGKIMSLLTIVEASKQFNVTRPRIYRAIKKGELTTALNEDGIQVVQVQDMIRLFDNIKKKPVPKNVRNAVSNTDIKLVTILEEQLRKAE